MENEDQIEKTETTETETPETEEIETAAEEAFSPDDAILERAVKAGMSLADAKALPSKEFAERILGQLEKGRTAGVGEKPDVGGDDFPAIDFGDLTEENGYEPNIVRSFNSLKSVIEAQAKVIKELRAGYSARGKEKAVESRKNLILARPGGEKPRSSSGKGDAEAQILDALRAKFKLN